MDIDTNIEWKTEKRLIKDLVAHERNPRTLSKKSYKDLISSFKRFNYVELAAINLDNTILAGHQRIHIMQDLGWDDKEIEVRVPTRLLTKKEADNYLIVSNKVTGDWDHDILADQWEEEELYAAGFSKEDLYGKQEEEKDIDDTDLEMNDKLVVEIECKNHKEQKELYEELITRGLTCRLLSL